MEFLFGEEHFAVERFGVAQGVDGCAFGDHFGRIEKLFGDHPVVRRPKRRIADLSIDLCDCGIECFGVLFHRLKSFGEFGDLLFIDSGNLRGEFRFTLLYLKCLEVLLHRVDLSGECIGFALDIFIVRFGDETVFEHFGKTLFVTVEFSKLRFCRIDVKPCRCDLLLQTLCVGIGDLALKFQCLFQALFFQLCRFDLFQKRRFFMKQLDFGVFEVNGIDTRKQVTFFDRLILRYRHLHYFAAYFEREHREFVASDKGGVTDGIVASVADITKRPSQHQYNEHQKYDRTRSFRHPAILHKMMSELYSLFY